MPDRLIGVVRGERRGSHLAWVVGACLLVAAVASVIWAGLWTPPEGVVVNGSVVLAGDGAREAFAGTGWLVVVAAATGLLSGAAVGLLARVNELTTLAGLLLGSTLGSVLMSRLGPALGPPDPSGVAARSVDYTSLPLPLDVPGIAPFLVLPIGTLAGFFLALVLSPTHLRVPSAQVPDAG